MVKEGKIYRVDYGVIRDLETDEVAGVVKTLKAGGRVLKSSFEYNDLAYHEDFVERNETPMFGVIVTQDETLANRAFVEFRLNEILKSSW